MTQEFEQPFTPPQLAEALPVEHAEDPDTERQEANRFWAEVAKKAQLYPGIDEIRSICAEREGIDAVWLHRRLTLGYSSLRGHTPLEWLRRKYGKTEALKAILGEDAINE